jgi:deoxyribodipyrimidine photo-lyase
MTQKVTIIWFRQDLRLSDNPALVEAAKNKTVLPIYILDDENAGDYRMGGATRWWLHYSLASLKKSLDGALSLYHANAIDVFKDLCDRFDIQSVHWNRCYEPWRMERDTKIKDFLKSKDIEVKSYNGSLLWEPWQVKKDDGDPYKVFTPFYRKGCLNLDEPRAPLNAPKDVDYCHDKDHALELEALKLLPNIAWDKQLEPHWTIGEDGAHQRFQAFLDEGLSHYKEGRNLPAKPYVSRLSPYLRFGEISPNQLWHTVRNLGDDKNIDHFCSELGWREFSYSQLYYNPDSPKKNLQEKFDDFPWVTDDAALTAWQKGQTGVPMVDAGMRNFGKPATCTTAFA